MAAGTLPGPKPKIMRFLHNWSHRCDEEFLHAGYDFSNALQMCQVVFVNFAYEARSIEFGSPDRGEYRPRVRCLKISTKQILMIVVRDCSLI